MKISKGMVLALLVGGYLWSKGKQIVNSLHTQIVKVRIVNFWANLGKGVFELELTFWLANQSNLDITINTFVGKLNWRGLEMAQIDLAWDNTPILPGAIQEMTFTTRGRFVDGIAAAILAVHNPGSRLLDGVTVDGTITMTINRAMLKFPYHQEISITL